jgi:hypothetical protein
MSLQLCFRLLSCRAFIKKGGWWGLVRGIST